MVSRMKMVTAVEMVATTECRSWDRFRWEPCTSGWQCGWELGDPTADDCRPAKGSKVLRWPSFRSCRVCRQEIESSALDGQTLPCHYRDSISSRTLPEAADWEASLWHWSCNRHPVARRRSCSLRAERLLCRRCGKPPAFPEVEVGERGMTSPTSRSSSRNLMARTCDWTGGAVPLNSLLD